MPNSCFCLESSDRDSLVVYRDAVDMAMGIPDVNRGIDTYGHVVKCTNPLYPNLYRLPISWELDGNVALDVVEPPPGATLKYIGPANEVWFPPAPSF